MCTCVLKCSVTVNTPELKPDLKEGNLHIFSIFYYNCYIQALLLLSTSFLLFTVKHFFPICEGKGIKGAT